MRPVILIADDESSGRETMAAMLAGENYELVFADDGADALARATAATPDLVLLDVMMPGMDGFEVCRRLRADPRLAEVPVIFTTVLDDRASRLAGLEAGADDFLSKPLNRLELRTRLRSLTRLNRYRRLLEERSRLGWVLDGADEGYLLLDGAGLVTFANPAAARLLQLPADGDRAFRAHVDARFTCTPSEAWTTWPNAPATALLLRSQDASDTAPCWLRLDTLDTPAGQTAERLVRLRDVSAEVTLEARVRERTAELEAANRELEGFASAVAHDLRAPLRAVDAFTRALDEDCGAVLDANGRQLLERVLINTQRMGDLIADLLRLARVARTELQRRPLDLSALAAEVVAGLRDADPQRQVEVVIAPGLAVSADPGLTRVLLDNLLGNAWKFTRHREGARIEVGAATGNGAFVVADNGAGFDMAAADGLFRPFRRLHRSDEFEGTGIGLATARRIVHRHGGRIWADAKVDRGARFVFTLAPGPDWTPPPPEPDDDAIPDERGR